MKKYVLKRDRFEHPAGTTVYEFGFCTYGLCGDDERATGAPHTAVTLDPGGNYPFFTVPEAHLQLIEETK